MLLQVSIILRTIQFLISWLPIVSVISSQFFSMVLPNEVLEFKSYPSLLFLFETFYYSPLLAEYGSALLVLNTRPFLICLLSLILDVPHLTTWNSVKILIINAVCTCSFSWISLLKCNFHYICQAKYYLFIMKQFKYCLLPEHTVILPLLPLSSAQS